MGHHIALISVFPVSFLVSLQFCFDNQESQEWQQAQQSPGGDHDDCWRQEEPPQREGRDGEGEVQEGSYQGCSQASCCHHQVPEGSASQEGS